MADLELGLLLKMYRNMVQTRRFEEEMFEYYKSGLMPGMIHLSFGQEAVGTGAVAPLLPEDFIAVTHRSHAHFFMRGTPMNLLLCEILGKRHGFNKGKGGTIHAGNFGRRIMGLTGTLGSNYGVVLGPAYWQAMKKMEGITVVFSGDGCTNEGVFHESLNMAKAWTLPILYIIENNLYGMYTDTRTVTGVKDLSIRARGYDIPGITVDGNDVELVYKTVDAAAEYVRKGGGPMIVELKTYRMIGHHVAEGALYQDPEEKAAWRKRDPIEMLEKTLVEKRGVKKEELEAIRADVEVKLADAKTFAEQDEYADLSVAFEDVLGDN